MDQELKLKDFISEETLLEILSMKPEALADLRTKGLPVIRVNRLTRFYQESDVVTFFLKNKLDRGVEVQN